LHLVFWYNFFSFSLFIPKLDCYLHKFINFLFKVSRFYKSSQKSLHVSQMKKVTLWL
jgi:hypothetical protein